MSDFWRRWRWTVIAGVAILVLDQITKALVVRSLGPDESRVVIPGLLAWSYVQNVHGAYGLFGARPSLLIAMAVAVLVLFAYTFKDLTAHSAVARFAYGAIVAGALGNVIDRTRYGYVIDFISIKPLPIFEVFNVADSAICVGVALLLLTSLRKGRSVDGSDPGAKSAASGS